MKFRSRKSQRSRKNCVPALTKIVLLAPLFVAGCFTIYEPAPAPQASPFGGEIVDYFPLQDYEQDTLDEFRAVAAGTHENGALAKEIALTAASASLLEKFVQKSIEAQTEVRITAAGTSAQTELEKRIRTRFAGGLRGQRFVASEPRFDPATKKWTYWVAVAAPKNLNPLVEQNSAENSPEKSVPAELEKSVPAENNARKIRVCGEYFNHKDSNISGQEAQSLAREKAMKMAVEKFGEKQIKSFKSVVSRGNDSTIFAGTTVDVGGVVRSPGIIEEKSVPEADGIRYFCIAEPLVESAAGDPEFYADVRSNHGEHYKHGERANFGVVSSQNARLMIFWINENQQADLVFPQTTFDENLLAANEVFNTPDFEFVLENKKASREKGTLIFVLTKTPHAFLRPAETPKNAPLTSAVVEDWIFRIPARERVVSAIGFEIKK